MIIYPGSGAISVWFPQVSQYVLLSKAILQKELEEVHGEHCETVSSLKKGAPSKYLRQQLTK